eukprot:g3042.t1
MSFLQPMQVWTSSKSPERKSPKSRGRQFCNSPDHKGTLQKNVQNIQPSPISSSPRRCSKSIETRGNDDDGLDENIFPSKLKKFYPFRYRLSGVDAELVYKLKHVPHSFDLETIIRASANKLAAGSITRSEYEDILRSTLNLVESNDNAIPFDSDNESPWRFCTSASEKRNYVGIRGAVFIRCSTSHFRDTVLGKKGMDAQDDLLFGCVGGNNTRGLEMVVESSEMLKDSSFSSTPEVPEQTAMFAFPRGAGLVAGKPPEMRYSSFFFSGAQLFGHCAISYQPLRPCLAKIVREAWTSRAAALKSSETCSLYQVERNDTQDAEIPLFEPVCICILVQGPWYSTCRTLLGNFLRQRKQVWTADVLKGLIEAIANFSQSKRIANTNKKEDFIKLPEMDVSLVPLLLCLSAKNIIALLTAMLCEEKIVMFSQDCKKLVDVQEALIALLYPFEWAVTYIPVFPLDLLEQVPLSTPFPLLIGIPATLALASSLDVPSDAMLVDLDSNFIRLLSTTPKFPNSTINYLTKQITQAQSLYFHSGNAEKSSKIIRNAFVSVYIQTFRELPLYVDYSDDILGPQIDISEWKRSLTDDRRDLIQRFAESQSVQSTIHRFFFDDDVQPFVRACLEYEDALSKCDMEEENEDTFDSSQEEKSEEKNDEKIVVNPERKMVLSVITDEMECGALEVKNNDKKDEKASLFQRKGLDHCPFSPIGLGSDSSTKVRRHTPRHRRIQSAADLLSDMRAARAAHKSVRDIRKKSKMKKVDKEKMNDFPEWISTTHGRSFRKKQ